MLNELFTNHGFIDIYLCSLPSCLIGPYTFKQEISKRKT